MRKKILIVVLMLLALGIITWAVLRNLKIPNEDNQQQDITNTETITISPEKPASFEGVEMVTYKSAYGYHYEITYPKKWTAVLAPKESSNDLENYAIYPKDIPYGPSPIFTVIVLNSSMDGYFRNQTSLEYLAKVSLNGIVGYRHKSALHEATFYIFPINEKTLIRIEYWPSEKYDVTEQEALWVLSTFKIVE